MNKDIQTLIEREAREHWSHSNYKEAAEKAHSENDICKTSAMARKVSNSSFQAGAHFTLSLFKWRKVSEELPEMETVLIKVMCHYPNGNHEVKVTTGTISSKDKCNLDNEFIEEITRSYKAIEWMPIPNND